MINSIHLSVKNKRRGTVTIEEMTREDFLEEQSQLNQIHESNLKNSISIQVINTQGKEKNNLLH
jgi:hypothetical protein